jgi:hypothetical protein
VLKEGVEPYFKIKTDITEPLTGIELYASNYKINGFFPPSAVWMYLFKKELLDKYNIRFKAGIEHEDEEYTPRVHFFAQRDSYLNIPIQFHRVMRKGSITASTILLFKERNIRDIIETSSDLYSFLQDQKCVEQLFYLAVFHNYLSVALLIIKNNPKRKTNLFSLADFEIMKSCAISWDWYTYYWFFRYNTPIFRWYILSGKPLLVKKLINRFFKIYYNFTNKK